MRNKKGFTLVELLVAMAIIALLISLSVYGISLALKRSRDTKRQSVVADLSKALAAYEGKKHVYPSSLTVSGQNVIVGPTTPSGVYNETVPVDFTTITVYSSAASSGTTKPATNQVIVVYCTPSGGGYGLGSKMEDGDWYYMTSTTCP